MLRPPLLTQYAGRSSQHDRPSHLSFFHWNLRCVCRKLDARAETQYKRTPIVAIFLLDISRRLKTLVAGSKAVAARPNRPPVRVYCGTDHCSTEPEALFAVLREPETEGFLLARAGAVFHAKAVVLECPDSVLCFVGSNNLTNAGLTQNYELGARLEISRTEYQGALGLRAWETAVHAAAVPLTARLVEIYREEYAAARNLPQERRAVSPRRANLVGQPAAAAFPPPRSAVLEVMPRETGTHGTQLQIPLQVARTFFGLPPGGQTHVDLVDARSGQQTALTFTDYGNNTRRLSIARLAEPRPSVVWFAKAGHAFEFDVVSQATMPDEFARLLSLCLFRHSPRSKKWVMLEEPRP